MEGQGCFGNFIHRCKPYIAMISLQFGYAGMNIITKVSLNRGMSHYVLVVYRHAFATAVIAPFALVLERKVRPKITLPIFLQIFVLGLLGPVIDQNFYYAGLKFTSPTFSCAMSNMLPAMTFVMAVICRMEKLDMKKVRCQAKVVGTIVTVAGAMLMTLYKGSVIKFFWSEHMRHPRSYAPTGSSGTSDKDWLKGSILLIIATFAWASFFIIQAVTMKRYSAQLSLTALVCFMGTLQSIAVTFVMEHKPSAWTIGWDMNLLAAAYAGIVSSSIAYYVQGLVMEKRGPVFVTAFSPLMMIIVAIMGSFILAENIYLGGVLGAALIVIGLYSVLWGKYKEYKEKEAIETIPEAVKGEENGRLPTVMEDIEANHFEMPKSEANKETPPVVAISLPIPQPPSSISSSGNASLPHSLGKPGMRLGLAESNYHPVAPAVPLLTNPKGLKNIQWEERYHQLQMLLRKLDEADQEEYLQLLRTLSPVELSKHAVDLEKRSIQLSLEEAKELQRVAALNVLGKSLKNFKAPSTHHERLEKTG